MRRKYDSGCSSRIRILTFYPSDPGSRGQKGTGSGSATLENGNPAGHQEEERRRKEEKEEEARRRREELIKKKAEEQREKREERIRRVQETVYLSSRFRCGGEEELLVNQFSKTEQLSYVLNTCKEKGRGQVR
jgi:hypothetical protein